MHLSSSSAAGVRFLISVGEGRGLNRSAREAGVGKETGYRWLREAYVAYRRGGKSIAETEAVLGLASAKSIAWEAELAAGPGRHHLRSPSRRRLGSGRSMTPALAPMRPSLRLGLAGRLGIGGWTGDFANSARLGSPSKLRSVCSG
jgi:hypothetical protein